MDFFPPRAVNEQRPPQHAYPCPVCERTVVVNGTDQFSLLGYRVICPDCGARLQLDTDQNGLIALAPLAFEQRYAGEWA
jgi:transcription elongation factor Elf1